MSNGISRTWAIGGSIAMLTFVVTASMAMAASISTTMLLVALGIAPGVAIAVLHGGATLPTMAEILHPADNARAVQRKARAAKKATFIP